MAGAKIVAVYDLATLLKSLTVKQHEGVWAYTSLPKAESSWADLVNLRSVRDIALLFTEAEGLTVIHAASAETARDNRWVWLELAVYSDLNAVGFLAAVAEALRRAGVPCNAVAAYHHDHLFVPEDKVEAALNA